MADRWAPAELPGLWVRFADRRAPAAARFTCRYGCLYEAYGARDVAAFTKHIDESHARDCPGPPHDDRPVRDRP
jgi:hypothetical protein